MESKILIAGAGHGGIVAAYYLAQAGLDVTIYEKSAEGELGHDQSDFIHLDGFEKAGIPIPEEYMRVRIPISFCLPESDIEPLSQVEDENLKNVCIDRKVLYDYLLSFALSAGAKIVYNCEVLSPIRHGSRIVGLKTSLGDFYGDMIIDACGVHSPVRSQLPDFMHIEQVPKKYDVLTAYRAVFKKLEGFEDSPYKYRVSMLLGGFTGITWFITEENQIDILLGSFNGITQDDIAHQLEVYKNENPNLSDELLQGGNIAEIPARQPLAVLVADGYAAVGDSAFMTVPVKGSGIGYAMRAGKMLADCIIADKDGLYNRETLWAYQKDYFEDIGFGSCILAVLKNKFPTLDAGIVEYAFNERVVTSEDLTLFGSEANAITMLRSLNLSKINDKTKKVLGNAEIRKTIAQLVKWIARYKIVESFFPHKYDSADIERWAKAYNNFFDSIKASDEEIEAEE